MIRILVRHAKLYRGHTFLRTLSSSANQTLQNRLTEALDQKAQIILVLKQWRQHGNHINPSHVRVIIEKLRGSDQSLQALQVSEWMLNNVVELEEAEKSKVYHIARETVLSTLVC